MKKLSLVLLLWLSACCLVFGQVSSAKRTLFNEANGTLGKRVPSNWKENDGLYWKSLDIAVGKDYSAVQVKGNLVELAIVGCMVANKSAQTRWLKESYDTLVADKWVLVSGNADDFVLSKNDRLASSNTSNDGGTHSAHVVFITVSTALAANAGGTTWTTVDITRMFGRGIEAVTYGNNKFVAVGMDSSMATSTDGITWTAVNVRNQLAPSFLTSIAYGNGMFVAGGYNAKITYLPD